MDFYFLDRRSIRKANKDFYVVTVYEDQSQTSHSIWVNSDKYKLFDGLERFDNVNDIITFKYNLKKGIYELAI